MNPEPRVKRERHLPDSLDNRRKSRMQGIEQEIPFSKIYYKTRETIYSVITVSQRHPVHLGVAEYGNDFACYGV